MGPSRRLSHSSLLVARKTPRKILEVHGFSLNFPELPCRELDVLELPSSLLQLTSLLAEQMMPPPPPRPLPLSDRARL